MSRLFSRRPSQPANNQDFSTSSGTRQVPNLSSLASPRPNQLKSWGHQVRQSIGAHRDVRIPVPNHSTTPLLPPPSPSFPFGRPQHKQHASKSSVTYSSRQAYWLRFLRHKPSRNILLTSINLIILISLLIRSARFPTPPPPSLAAPSKIPLLDTRAPPSAFVAPLPPPPSHKATDSCELCIISPDDPFCKEYGIDNIKLSRAYQGSGFRVRKVIEKALRGEVITIGVLGASVTSGHGVPDGKNTWHKQFLEDFTKMFPKTELYNGASAGMNSAFFGWCFDALVPRTLDMYLIELDINNEAIDATYRDDDTLFRGLLGLPQQPAVLRVSVFALSFGDLARGTVSALIMSQFFDVPVISIRNFLLPILMHNPNDTSVFFSTDQWGGTDTRHISWLSHQAMGDMLAIYMREQVCETKRGKLQPAQPRDTSFTSENTLGIVPNQYIWNTFNPAAVPVELNPSCKMTGSALNPLIPVASKTVGVWKTEEWNGKKAITSFQAGATISFAFKGTKVGIFVWSSNGKTNKEPPGRAQCWVDDMKKNSVVVDAYIDSDVATSRWTLLQDNLSVERHLLTCKILKESSTSGKDFRIIGVGTQ